MEGEIPSFTPVPPIPEYQGPQRKHWPLTPVPFVAPDLDRCGTNKDKRHKIHSSVVLSVFFSNLNNFDDGKINLLA